MIGGLGDKFAYLSEGGYENIMSLIASAIAILISLATLIKLLVMGPREAKKADSDIGQTDAKTDQTIADTMNSYEEAIKRANERAERVELRLHVLETSIGDKQKKIDDLVLERDQMVAEFRTQMAGLESERRRMIAAFESEIADRDRQIKELVDWAERLVHQVQSLGGSPVALRPNSVPSIERPTRPSGKRKKSI